MKKLLKAGVIFMFVLCLAAVFTPRLATPAYADDAKQFTINIYGTTKTVVYDGEKHPMPYTVKYIIDGHEYSHIIDSSIHLNETATDGWDLWRTDAGGYAYTLSNTGSWTAPSVFEGDCFSIDATGTSYSLDSNNTDFLIAEPISYLIIEPAPLTITALDQTYTYNGEIQGEGDTAYEDPAEIAEKVTVEGLKGDDHVEYIVLDGQAKDIGTHEDELQVTGIMIRNGDGENVTYNYDITYVPGTIKIEDPDKQYCDLTFDLAGGTLDGQTGTITMTCEIGSTINLPGAPSKEGYKFLYWKGSEYAAGVKYTVEGPHTFTAEWEAVEPDKPAKNPDTPDTGDGSMPGMWIGLMLISLLAAVRLRKAYR